VFIKPSGGKADPSSFQWLWNDDVQNDDIELDVDYEALTAA